MNEKTEELINTIDPDKFQCVECKRFITVEHPFDRKLNQTCRDCRKKWKKIVEFDMQNKTFESEYQCEFISDRRTNK